MKKRTVLVFFIEKIEIKIDLSWRCPLSPISSRLSKSIYCI